MKSINSYPDNVVKALKAGGYLNQFTVTRAFPKTAKPSPLTYSLITVGIDSFELNTTGIGADTKCGDLNIFADIYIPIKLGGKGINTALQNVYNACALLEPCKIKSGRTHFDNSTQAYKTEVIITFNNEFTIGGEM